MLNLLGSHDTERLLTRHRGDVPAALRAYALLFAAEGAPMLYYGDEIGLTGENDPGCRGTMPWDESEWSPQLLEGIRSLSGARSECPALRRGVQEVRAIDGDTVLMIRRAPDGETSVAIVHRGDGARIPILALPDLASDRTWQVVAGDATLAGDGSLVLGTGGVGYLNAFPNEAQQ
jgi:glycosidase